MCTKYFADGDVHKYFNPYDSPYDSYINFMNIFGNLHLRCVKTRTDTDLNKTLTNTGRTLATENAVAAEIS